MKKENLFITSLIFLVLLSSAVYAMSYTYNQKTSIMDNGKEIGYVKPYQENVWGTNYAYLEWQRYGFPVGYSFPIALIKGTTTALPFGVQGELLRVKIGTITNSAVELTIDQADIVSEIDNLDETLPENIEAINEEIDRVTQPIIEDIDLRLNKFVNRNYHSSLHVVDTSNSKLKEMSKRIENKEAELAEEIGDSVVSSVLNAFVAPGSGIGYKTLVNQLPSSFRHDVTAFLYNIEYTSDKGSESSFSDKGVATLYLGNPDLNQISKQFNDELKSLGLPHFEGDKVVGKRTYSSLDIGIIAAIPEEKYWDKTTLQMRWDKDKIRLYKTMIAGIDDEGLETAVLWYNDQLELAKDSISTIVRLAGGSIDEGGVELNEIVSEIGKNAQMNPEATIGFATIAQGWTLTGVSSLQEPDFEKVDSLGYVVIVKKDGRGYRVLETHTLVGNKRNYFLGDYVEEVSEVTDMVRKVEEIAYVNRKADSQNNQVTGKVVEEQQADEVEEDSPIVSFFKKIWRWFGG